MYKYATSPLPFLILQARICTVQHATSGRSDLFPDRYTFTGLKNATEGEYTEQQGKKKKALGVASFFLYYYAFHYL